jgi:non-ribosomal peptide synthetase component F
VLSALPDPRRLHLTTLVSAGEACTAPLAQRWSATQPFINAYGPTEATVCATFHRYRHEDGPSLPIGQPIANARIYVLSAQLQPLPVGVAGEIYIGGAGVGRGYLNRPDLTIQRFLADPFSADPQARMYKTGDLGQWRADGAIEYLGRNDHQVKIRGFRIELGEIETQLTYHEKVVSALVLAREDIPGEKRLVAYVTAADEPPSADALRSHLQGVLPEYMVPSAFVVLESFPLTPNGKVDRRALPTPEPRANSCQEYEAPQGEVEEILAEIWRETLYVKRVGRNQHFFELGGNSLSAMTVAARISARFTVELSPITLFHHPTLHQLALSVRSLAPAPVTARISAAQATPGPVARAPGEQIPLSLSQALRWGLNRDYFRATTFARRIRVELDLELFRKSIRELIQRHEALRTNIVVVNGVPTQQVRDFLEYDLEEQDLTAIAHDRLENEVSKQITQCILQPVHLGKDPLFSFKLLKIGRADYVLIVATEHMISDGVSVQILWRDLLLLYVHKLRGGASELPEIPVQFPDYAVWQIKAHGQWLERHGVAWADRLKDCRPARFPTQASPSMRGRRGWGSARVKIGGPLKTQWEAWCRKRRTTLPLSALSVYTALLSRWCAAPEVAIQLRTNGRPSPAVENAVGLFSSVVYVRVRLRKTDTLADVMQRVIDDYGQSYAIPDFCYLGAELPRPELAYIPSFNWLPKPPFSRQFLAATDSITTEPVAFEHPFPEVVRQDPDPSIVFHESADEVHGHLIFPNRRFSKDSMERLMDNLVPFLKTMLTTPKIRLQDIPLQ